MMSEPDTKTKDVVIGGSLASVSFFVGAYITWWLLQWFQSLLEPEGVWYEFTITSSSIVGWIWIAILTFRGCFILALMSTKKGREKMIKYVDETE